MPASVAQSQPSPARILRELESLPFATLDKLMPKITALRLKKHPDVMSRREAWLTKNVQAGPPRALRDEYEALMAKRDTGRLTSADRERLPELVDAYDTHNARHLRWLMELARLRHTSVQTLVEQMGLPTH